MKKLLWIDALRGIAIILVIFMHAGWNWKGADWHGDMNETLHNISMMGQMGVQLFFIVSAITLCLSNQGRQTEEHPLLHFYSRRFFRIAPAYWFGILFYWIFCLCENYYNEHIWRINNYYSVFNMLTNFSFLHGFYKPANSNIVPGGWSIGTEMAFYVIFPSLWILQKKISLRKIWILPAVSIAVTFTIFFAAYVWKGFVIVDNSFAYFNLVNQINVFIIGITGYRFLKQPPSRTFSIAIFLLFVCIGAILWKSELPLSFYWIPAVFGIAFLGLSFYFSQVEDNVFLNFLAPVGKVSFSMYLFHFAVMTVVHITFSKINLVGFMNGNWIFLLLFLVTCQLTYFVAKHSYKYIEQPGIKIGKMLTNKFINFYISKKNQKMAN